MPLTRRIAAIALSAWTVLLLLSSCASFPAHASANDTLLVIPVQLRQEAPGNPFGRAMLTIEGINDRSVQRQVETGPWTTMVFVRGLAPGPYRISKQQFIYDSLHPRTVWVVSRSVLIFES